MPATMPVYLFVFLVEMGFRHVGQAGLKLLTSGDLSALASQSVGIIGVSDHAWSVLKKNYNCNNVTPFPSDLQKCFLIKSLVMS